MKQLQDLLYKSWRQHHDPSKNPISPGCGSRTAHTMETWHTPSLYLHVDGAVCSTRRSVPRTVYTRTPIMGSYFVIKLLMRHRQSPCTTSSQAIQAASRIHDNFSHKADAGACVQVTGIPSHPFHSIPLRGCAPELFRPLARKDEQLSTSIAACEQLGACARGSLV